MQYEYQGQTLYPTIEAGYDLVALLTGVTLREMFLDPERCGDAWEKGLPEIHNRYPDLELKLYPGPAAISYGHLVCLGCPIEWPEDSEPNVHPAVHSVGDAIAMLRAKANMDFTAEPLYQHYLNVRDHLRQRFPDANIGFTGFSSQGPLTSAVLFRGQDFFLDLYDEPEATQEFLRLITDSCIAFVKRIRIENDLPEIVDRGYVSDDFASLVPPAMWGDFVLPYWKRHYAELSTGPRFLHCENLTPAHLPLLEELGLDHFQASVSQQLTLADMRRHLTMKYDWLLTVPDMMAMNDAEIDRWVQTTVEAGVTRVRAAINRYVVRTPGGVDRLRAFRRAFERYAVR